MRTTIRIDDDLYRAVKERAARTDRTIGNVIEDAIRRSLEEPESRDEDEIPPLPIYGGTGTLPGVDLADNAALRDIMDGDETVDALR